jgi:DNA ligase-1
MIPYARIASVLEDTCLAARGDKDDVAFKFLEDLETDRICPMVRLMMGELWPSWKLKEMGIGPETLMMVLSEISREDISLLRREAGEIGLAAQMALKRKSQQQLCPEVLDALSVYERLRHISDQSGPESDYRKAAILRGLLLEASPLEGKYIARTVMGSPLAGLGPYTMISAISRAFNYDYKLVRRAYSFMPELGMLAMAAAKQKLDEIGIDPPIPVRPMLVRPGEMVLPGAYLPRYPGLRVQIHNVKNTFYAYTARLRNITPSLTGLFENLDIGHDFVAEACLMGSKDGRIQGEADIIRYINHRQHSRRSRTAPALVAYDLLYVDGENLMEKCYKERRNRMESVFGAPRSLPFIGLSIAEELMLERPEDVERYRHKSISSGAKGLIWHDLYGLYTPGEYGPCLLLKGAEETVTTAIVMARFGEGRKSGILTRYRVALRSGDDYVPVGWVSSGLRSDEIEALSNDLKSISLKQSHDGIVVPPRIILEVIIAGARFGNEGYMIIHPRIKRVELNAPLKDVDDIQRLDVVSRK